MSELQIGYELSPSAQAYVAAQRRSGMRRDSARTCSRGELERLLATHQLPVSDAIWDFERNLGGWCSEQAQSTHGLGIYLSLQEDASASAVAAEFRRTSWLFDRQQDEADDDNDVTPIWGKGFPRAFFLDRALVPAGMAGEDVIYFLGERGEVYAFIPPLNELYLCAGSGRTLLERNALGHVRGAAWFEAHVCADAAQTLAAALDVAVYEPACDELFKYWANDEVHIQRCPDVPPCIFGTRISCKSAADFLSAMRSVAGQLGPETMRLWRNANNSVTNSGIHLLSSHDIPYQVVVGAGDGEHAWIEAPDPHDNLLVRYAGGRFESVTRPEH